jgi:hypothetical protein
MSAVFEFNFGHMVLIAEAHRDDLPGETAVLLEMWVFPVHDLNARQPFTHGFSQSG